MEPFSLTVEQINFEADDPSLRNFDSDIVFYDTDLRSTYRPTSFKSPVASYNTVFLQKKKGQKESSSHLKTDLNILEEELRQLVTQIHTTSKLCSHTPTSEDGNQPRQSHCIIESQNNVDHPIFKLEKINGELYNSEKKSIITDVENSSLKDISSPDCRNSNIFDKSFIISPTVQELDHFDLSPDSEFALQSLSSPHQDFKFGHLALHSESSFDLTSDSIPVRDVSSEDAFDVSADEVRTAFDSSFATNTRVAFAKNILQSLFLENFETYKKKVLSDLNNNYFKSTNGHAINFLHLDLDSAFAMNSSDEMEGAEDRSCVTRSPLTAFSSTSDALALQESVIGSSNITPAPPEIVAQVVAEAQRKLIMAQQGTQGFRSLSPSSFDPPEKLLAAASTSEVPSFDQSSILQPSPNRPELIRIPNESITTVTSKGSGVIESVKASPSRKVRKHKKKSSSATLQSSEQLEEASLPPSRGSSEEELSNIRPLEIDVVSSEEILPTQNYSPPVKDVGLEMPKEMTTAQPHSLNSEVVNTSLEGFIHHYLNSVAPQEHNLSSISSSFEPFQSRNCKSPDYYELARQKANLEGQLETIRNQTNSLLKERARLQAELATISSQLKSQMFQTQKAIADKNKLNCQIEILMESQQKLVRNLEELQSSYDSKIAELKALNDELLETQDGNDKLSYKVEEIKLDLKSKEGIIEDLKKKIAELHVEVQLASQAKIAIENELRVAQNDIAALVTAKQWYQEQLNLAQEARKTLQQEFMSLQSNSVVQASSIEKLKAANSHLRQELMETQQKSMREKEMLMRYLENIEADMMEREVAYDQIQREKSSTEETLSLRMQRVEEERTRLASMLCNTSDLERQLTITQNELHLKASNLTLTEHENAELMKQLTMSQESLVESRRALEILQQEYMEIDNKLIAAKKQLLSKDDEILKLKDEKTSVELTLASALEEKRAFDDAMQKLRNNMVRVELNFKQIRQELIMKTNMVEQLEAEKQKLIVKDVKAHTTDLLKNDSQLVKVMEEKVLLQTEISLLQDEHNSLKDICKKTNDEKQLLQEEIDLFKIRLSEMESRFVQMFANQESEIKKDITSQFVQTLESSYSIDKELSNTEKGSQSVDNLSKKCLDAERKDEQKLKLFESLTIKLDHIIDLGENYEQHLQELVTKYSLSNEVKEYLFLNWNNFVQEINAFTEIKNDFIYKLNDVWLKDNLSAMDLFSQIEKKDACTQQTTEEVNLKTDVDQELLIELEKERGRLAGMAQSFETLQQHVNMLETVLAKKEAALIDMEEGNKMLSGVQEQLKANALKQFQTLNDDLMDAKKDVKLLQKQVATQKGQNIRLKRELETMKSSSGKFIQDLEKKNTELLAVQNSLTQQQQSSLHERSEHERILSERSALENEVERLKRELTDSLAKHPVFKEEIKTLTWQLSQKQQELDALKEQLKLTEERQQLDKDNLSKAYQMSCEEVSQLKAELMATRKEKYSYQSKFIELRAALKASVQQNQKLKAALTEVDSKNVLVSAPDTMYDETALNELLKQSLITSNSKPLSNLQRCLVKLQSEMSSLKSKMEEHQMVIIRCGNT